MRDQVPPTPRPTFTVRIGYARPSPFSLALLGLCVPLLYTIGTPTYTVTVSLYNVDENQQPTGSALCSTTFAASS